MAITMADLEAINFPYYYKLVKEGKMKAKEAADLLFGKKSNRYNKYHRYVRFLEGKPTYTYTEAMKRRYEKKKDKKSKQWKQTLKSMTEEDANKFFQKHMIRITKEDTVLIKRCYKCMEYKVVSDFSKNKNQDDGIDSICKECHGKRVKEHREANPDYYKEKNRKHKEEKSKQWKQKLNKMTEEEINQHLLNNMIRIRIKKDDIVLIKRCPDCMRYKMVKEFSKDKNQKDGLQNNCRECRGKRKKESYEAKTQQALEDIRIIVEANPTKYDYIPGMDIFGIIYLVYNRITKRYYVGQTTISFDIRYKDGFFHNHIEGKKERKGKNETPNELLKQDLESYGEESFEFNKIFKVASNQYELDKIEAYWIDKLEAYTKGYNRNRGNWFTNRGLEDIEG